MARSEPALTTQLQGSLEFLLGEAEGMAEVGPESRRLGKLLGGRGTRERLNEKFAWERKDERGF